MTKKCVLHGYDSNRWLFSVVDVIAVLTDSKNPRNYWKVLKHLLTKAGNELVTNCNQLKIVVADGKPDDFTANERNMCGGNKGKECSSKRAALFSFIVGFGFLAGLLHLLEGDVGYVVAALIAALSGVSTRVGVLLGTGLLLRVVHLLRCCVEHCLKFLHCSVDSSDVLL